MYNYRYKNDQEVNSHYQVIAAKFKGPSAENTPKGMNPAAQEVWERVLEKYADKIYKGFTRRTFTPMLEAFKFHYGRSLKNMSDLPPSDPNYLSKEMIKTLVDQIRKKSDLFPKQVEDLTKEAIRYQWATAIIIFRRSATKNGVIPFGKQSHEGGGTTAIADDIRAKLNYGWNSANKYLKKFEKLLKAKQLLKTTLKEKLVEVDIWKNKIYYAALRKAKWSKDVDMKEVIGELKRLGFKYKNKELTYEWNDKVTSVVIDEDGLWIVGYITIPQAAAILNLDDFSDKKKVLKLYTKAMKRWWNSGYLGS